MTNERSGSWSLSIAAYAALITLLVTGLYASVPIWMMVAMVVAICSFRKARIAKPESMALGWISVIVILALWNLLHVMVHVTAIWNSGPASGVVLDAENGKPIQGARVIVVWRSPGLPPVAMPWYVYLIPTVQCEIASPWLRTNAQGEYALQWHGLKVWKGCSNASLTVYAEGYQPYHFPDYDARQKGESAARPFSHHVVKLMPQREGVPDTNAGGAD